MRGGAPLHGTVFVQGAKNAALKMIAASLLTANGHTVLRNVPPIEDVRRAVELAEAVGAVVEFHEPERTLVVDASHLTSPVLPAEIARRFRSSVLFVPALLHRFGEAVIEGVGGCTWATGTWTSTTAASPGSAPSSTRQIAHSPRSHPAPLCFFHDREQFASNNAQNCSRSWFARKPVA